MTRRYYSANETGGRDTKQFRWRLSQRAAELDQNSRQIVLGLRMGSRKQKNGLRHLAALFGTFMLHCLQLTRWWVCTLANLKSAAVVDSFGKGMVVIREVCMYIRVHLLVLVQIFSTWAWTGTYAWSSWDASAEPFGWGYKPFDLRVTHYVCVHRKRWEDV